MGAPMMAMEAGRGRSARGPCFSLDGGNSNYRAATPHCLGKRAARLCGRRVAPRRAAGDKNTRKPAENRGFYAFSSLQGGARSLIMQ